MTGQFSGTDAGNANLTITDGTTTGYGINKITVSAGDLTSASNGEAVIDTSGGGGGAGVSSISFDSTGLTPNTVSTGAIVVGGQLNIANGGTGADNAADARTNLGAGTMSSWRLEVNTLQGTVNEDTIVQIAEGTGISVVKSNDAPGGISRQTATINIDNVAVANGGTGASTESSARTNLGAASSGSNSDITALTGLTTELTVAQGGTGAGTFTNNGVLIGSGTSAVSASAGLKFDASATGGGIVGSGELTLGTDGRIDLGRGPAGGNGGSITGGVIDGGTYPTAIDKCFLTSRTQSRTSSFIADVSTYGSGEINFCNTGSNDITIVLPQTANEGGQLVAIKTSASNTLTVQSHNGVATVVNGAASVATNDAYKAFTIVCDGNTPTSNWYVIGV